MGYTDLIFEGTTAYGLIFAFVVHWITSIMAKTILIINGPNLNLLGEREPEVYGHKTLADIDAECKALAEEYSYELISKQSNHEGELIDIIQEARKTAVGIVINPGAYSHTSVALRDAISSVDIPVVEVHISNIHAREEFRHYSFISAVVDGVICGCGTEGYQFATKRLISLLG